MFYDEPMADRHATLSCAVSRFSAPLNLSLGKPYSVGHAPVESTVSY